LVANGAQIAYVGAAFLLLDGQATRTARVKEQYLNALFVGGINSWHMTAVVCLLWRSMFLLCVKLKVSSLGETCMVRMLAWSAECDIWLFHQV
jgi:hypothetical protein